MTGFADIEISLNQQCMFFLCSVALGGFIGVIYDVFRIFRIALKHNGIAVFFEDILFCFVTCVLLILMIFCANYGVVRWFSVFGCAGGFLIYRETVGKLVIGAANLIIGFIRKYIILPIVRLCRLVMCVCANLALSAVLQLKKLTQVVKRMFFCRMLIRRAGKGFGL